MSNKTADVLQRRNLHLGAEYDKAKRLAPKTSLGTAANLVRRCLIEHLDATARKYKLGG